MKHEFEEINELYTAIKDIDKIMSRKSNNESRLENVLHVVKEIDKSNYDPEIEESIIKYIRSAILKMYVDRMKTINDQIHVSGQYIDQTGTALDPNHIGSIHFGHPVVGVRSNAGIIDGSSKPEPITYTNVVGKRGIGDPKGITLNTEE